MEKGRCVRLGERDVGGVESDEWRCRALLVELRNVDCDEGGSDKRRLVPIVSNPFGKPISTAASIRPCVCRDARVGNTPSL